MIDDRDTDNIVSFLSGNFIFVDNSVRNDFSVRIENNIDCIDEYKPSKNKGVSTHEPVDVQISHNPVSNGFKSQNIEIDRGRWSKFAFEFLSIFVAVISAFALNNWNDHRKDNVAEHNILEEISNGLEKDIKDTEQNIMGHKYGLMACQYWRKVINDQVINSDSIQFHYFNLLRDFISLQNTSGYENLKIKGFRIDKKILRTSIISLYEYDYKTLKNS